ncbi:sugar phosphate isomerase/epimerase [Azospirillum sp. YIM B02556]|uniref:Sugar phosphate isomerase/epimerase n=1 Tax=Azospirillum endophyticum TaxID=2800326 RepID=A0ABS1FBU2_9PROT|nr:sugar phosphate isomerase/epimerase family protein [Azospirillum endophyticum]MBK1840865.1 sugar phosphate isomerase/epimerase [Azospirillum endophyticum]
MKLAITAAETAAAHAPIVLRGPFADTMRQAAGIGFDAVEYHLADPDTLDISRIRHVAKATGMAVASIGTGPAYIHDGLSLTSPDAGVRGAAVGRMLRFIRLAHAFDSVVIIGLIKGQIRECGDAAAYDRHLASALENCLPLAGELGVTLVLEAMNRYECDTLNTIDECLEFVKRFNSDRLKIHIDTFHMNIEEGDIRKSIEAGGARIGHVHIADSNRMWPGRGHYDFLETVQTLKAIGYTGALSVECLARPTPEEAAQGALDTLRMVTGAVRQP